MNRIAYITPSGRPPHTRITTTRMPTPIPNTHRPRFVTGDVTMSVAMYTAPRMSPPEKSMNGASGLCGSIACSTPLSSATVAMMLTGRRQLR